METLLLICAFVCFVNAILVFFAIYGGSKNDREVKLLNREVSRLLTIKADKIDITQIENKLFVRDEYEEWSKILRSDAVRFEKLAPLQLGIPFDKWYVQGSFNIKTCYTTKENAKKYKKEIEMAKKNVEFLKSEIEREKEAARIRVK